MKLRTSIVSVSTLATVLVFSATHARAEEGMDVPPLWKTNCASCHGEDGKEQMKPYGEKLSDAEIAALTDYILNTLK